jgi:hypothetical protein
VSQASSNQGAYVLDPKSQWASAWKIAAAIAAAGVVGTAVFAMQDSERFAFSYLFAYVAFLTIPLGAVFFGLIGYLTSAGWSVTIRRLTETLHAPLWLFVLLFAPIAANLDQLYPWTQDPHGAHHAEGGHGEEHGEAKGGEHSGSEHGAVENGAGIGLEGSVPAAEHALHAEVAANKTPYLNKTFFYIRALIYFAAWVLISRKLFTNSTKQDVSGDPALTASSQRVAPVFTILFAFTTTFASFDWLMSLEPSWISTIFGVNFFAQAMVSMFAVTILIALSLRAHGHYKNALNVEHFHDLGKYQFGFMVFWAYVNFSQYMLIWYASIPEETTYYHKRWAEGGEGWKTWSIALIFGHFVIPFFIVLSRNAKRALSPLALGAAIILLFHFAFVYWLVLPYFGEGLSPSLIDLTALMAVGGLYFAAVLYQLTKNPLIPVKDPRLSRSLHFVNF